MNHVENYMILFKFVCSFNLKGKGRKLVSGQNTVALQLHRYLACSLVTGPENQYSPLLTTVTTAPLDLDILTRASATSATSKSRCVVCQ